MVSFFQSGTSGKTSHYTPLFHSPIAFHLRVKAQVLSTAAVVSLLFFKYATFTPVSETWFALVSDQKNLQPDV